MFELNLASLPNHILYLDGVQLSYIKVYVHIFNLWQSNKSCYISNAEFAKRTNLHRDTVINAIQFFEKHNILKRVQKGSKRYLIQVSTHIETEIDSVDNSQDNCSNNVNESELDHGGVGVRPFRGSELDHHNNKNNNKYKKSFYMQKAGQKKLNEKKHDFADSMNQMANEKRHIEKHEEMKEEIKRTPMPDSLRQICKSLRAY